MGKLFNVVTGKNLSPVTTMLDQGMKGKPFVREWALGQCVQLLYSRSEQYCWKSACSELRS